MIYTLDQEKLKGNSLILSTMAVLLVLGSQLTNFIDTLTSYCLKTSLMEGRSNTYLNVIFATLSLLVNVAAYIIILKLFRKMVVRYLFFFILAFFSYIYVFEVQLLTTKKSLPMTIIRYPRY
jgi:hypothetical protein